MIKQQRFLLQKESSENLAAFIFCDPKMPSLTYWRLATLGGQPHAGFCLPLSGGLTSACRYRNPLVSNVGSKWVRLSNTSGITFFVCSELIIQQVLFFFKFLFKTSTTFQIHFHICRYAAVCLAFLSLFLYTEKRRKKTALQTFMKRHQTCCLQPDRLEYHHVWTDFILFSGTDSSLPALSADV